MLCQATLRDFYNCIANCDYPKAKRLIEGISVHNKNDGRSNMSKVITGLISVLTLEKKYYSFDFLVSKRKYIFPRKEAGSADSYGVLQEKMQTIVLDRSTEFDDEDNSLELAKCSLYEICDMRRRMAEMYVEISQLGKNDSRSIIDLIDLIRPLKDYLNEVIAVNKDSNLSLILPVLLLIELEIDILICLAEAQQLMSNLYFLVPISLLHSANSKYQQLAKTCSPLTSTSRLFSRPSLSLQLLSWLTDVYNTSLAKYTLYFYPILMRNLPYSPNAITESSFEENALELVNRISAFVKKSNASSVLLVFDATKQNHPFLGHGYVFPLGSGERLSGLQSYPVIFTCPPKLKLSQALHCAVVMLIGRMVNKADHADNIEYLAEPDGRRTFFLARIDFRVYLILIFEERRDREKLIINFIETIRTDLNGRSVIEQLSSLTG